MKKLLTLLGAAALLSTASCILVVDGDDSSDVRDSSEFSESCDSESSGCCSMSAECSDDKVEG